MSRSMYDPPDLHHVEGDTGYELPEVEPRKCAECGVELMDGLDSDFCSYECRDAPR